MLGVNQKWGDGFFAEAISNQMERQDAKKGERLIPKVLKEEENLIGMQEFSIRSISIDAERKSAKVVLSSRLDSSSTEQAVVFPHIKVTIRLKNLKESQSYYYAQARIEWERFWEYLSSCLTKGMHEAFSGDGRFCIRESVDDPGNVLKLEGSFRLENPEAFEEWENVSCSVIALLNKKISPLAEFAIMTTLRFLAESKN